MDKRLFAEIRTRRAYIGTILASLATGILIILQALILSKIINRAFIEQTAKSTLVDLFTTLFIIVILRAIIQAITSITAGEVAIRVKEDIRTRLIAHLMKLGPAFTQQERSGELAIAATSGINALDGYFCEYLPALFTAILIPVAILVIVLPVDLLTFVIMLITAPLIPIFMMLIGAAAGKLAATQYGQLGRMSAHFLDVMQGLATLKLFNRSKAQIQIIEQITTQLRHSTLNVLRVAFLSAFVLELLATISVAVVAVEIGLRLLANTIEFEQALFLLVVAPDFYIPLRQLAAKFHTGRDGIAAAERIYEILNTPVSIRHGTIRVRDVSCIQFQDVSFSYTAGSNRPALHGISFTIEAGQHVAFVGASGSGKSTVARLLLGFIQPESGTIQIGCDKHPENLLDLDIEHWRRQIAWVPQRSHLFNVSIADNIRLADPGASRESVIEAAHAASAHEFIQRVPANYDATPGENSIRLSGGQAQRIALARAFLRDVPVYIFDEATASLDSVNESEVLHNLKSHTRNSIMITIAHRLNTVEGADIIYVMDNGRIVESGAHQALINAQGAYYRLIQPYGDTPDA